MNDLQRIEGAIASLRSNPLYSLFRGSRELFHSNAQDWLIGECPEAVRLFVPSIDVPALPPHVAREKHNLDLVIELERDRIVVENKVKDIPRRHQLAEYTQKIDVKLRGDTKNVHKILLTLAPASFRLEDGWHELSYGELAGRIDLLPPLPRIEAEVFRQCYGRMVADLAEVAAAVMRVDAAERIYWFPRTNSQEAAPCDLHLEAGGLADTFGKHRAARLRVACLEHAAADPDLAALCRTDRPGTPTIIRGDEAGMTNKTPYAGLRVSTDVADKILALGIQIQGNQQPVGLADPHAFDAAELVDRAPGRRRLPEAHLGRRAPRPPPG